jgi:alkylation response protein AidB-like acyl-CoA dehydrogenase
MDFNDTAEEAAFRATVRAWLETNAPHHSVAVKLQTAGATNLALVEKARGWQHAKATAGYGAITWPTRFGGRGASRMEAVIFKQEEARLPVPFGVFAIGLELCLPTIMACGTEAQIQRFTRPALEGNEIWCQLFSEPGAGSDVAGVRMTAKRNGDDWTLNGQKVWTTGAHYCDFGIIIARSDADVPKHKGLTFFIVDMHAAGVKVRPIRQISGGASFNEVFFADVRVPDALRVGAVNDGWSVAMQTLNFERLSIASVEHGKASEIDALIDLASKITLDGGPAIRDRAVRERIADWYVEGQGLRYTNYRTLTQISRGAPPGPESSINKVVKGKRMQDMAAYAMELAEMGGVSLEGIASTFGHAYLYSPSTRTAGGTDEILRNIIAERVLGLPGDIRVDKTLPFSQLKRGA